MNLDEARKIVEKWSAYKQFPKVTLDGDIELFYQAKGLLEGHAIGQAEERRRCIALAGTHYEESLNCADGKQRLRCMKLQEDILKGEAEG